MGGSNRSLSFLIIGNEWPINRRVVKSSSGQFASELFSILTNCRPRCQFMFVWSIGLNLLPDVIVETNEPIIQHIFNGHHQLHCNSLIPFNFGPRGLGFCYFEHLLERMRDARKGARGVAQRASDRAAFS